MSEETIKPKYVPLPSGKEHEYYSGLGRSYLNTLILPCESNNYKPPVKSISLKKIGFSRGKRLIVLESLLDYIDSHLQVEK
jgi:hypothetical protein